MTSHVRHRRFDDAAAAFPIAEPGEIMLNVPNRQLAIGSTVTGDPVMLLAVRLFSTTSKYAAAELMAKDGVIYRARLAIDPGTYNPAQWDQITFSAADYVAKAGDQMEGPLLLAADPVAGLEACTKAYVDSLVPDLTPFVEKSGDEMEGPLLLAGPPTEDLEASSKKYVDDMVASGGTPIDLSLYVEKTGSTMTGHLFLPTSPAAANAVRKDYVDGVIAAVPTPDVDKAYVDTQDALAMKTAGRQVVTGGFRFSPYNAGALALGQVFTPDAYNSNYQFYSNGGAHTVAAPANDCALDLLVTNTVGAGAITFSGYVVGPLPGDALTLVNGHRFIISIRRINGVSTYAIKALQ
jgi:hypothetical protein